MEIGDRRGKGTAQRIWRQCPGIKGSRTAPLHTQTVRGCHNPSFFGTVRSGGGGYICVGLDALKGRPGALRLEHLHPKALWKGCRRREGTAARDSPLVFSPLQGCWRDGGGYIWESPGAGTALCQMEERALRLTLPFVRAGLLLSWFYPNAEHCAAVWVLAGERRPPERALGWWWWCRTCGAWGDGLHTPLFVVVGHGVIMRMQWGSAAPPHVGICSVVPTSLGLPLHPLHPTPSPGLCFNAAPQGRMGTASSCSPLPLLTAAAPPVLLERTPHCPPAALGPIGALLPPPGGSCRGGRSQCHLCCTAQSDPIAAALRWLGSRDP